MGSEADSKYDVEAALSFEEDLTTAVEFMLKASGANAAKRFLDRYAEMCLLLQVFPYHGSPVGADDLLWRELRPFTAVYEIDAEAHRVLLLRLHYHSSNWRNELMDIH